MGTFMMHPQQRNFCGLAWMEQVFTPEECQKIIGIYRQGRIQASSIFGDPRITSSSGESISVPSNSIRRSQQVWQDWREEVDWIFQRLAGHANRINMEHYGFQLSGFLEPLQLTQYEVGDYYNWHQDIGNGTASIRKLSIVVQLTDPAEYDGGELQIFEDPAHIMGSRAQGTVLFFPSYQVHRVLPVTRGTRNSLVAWMSGEPYR